MTPRNETETPRVRFRRRFPGDDERLRAGSLFPRAGPRLGELSVVRLDVPDATGEAFDERDCCGASGTRNGCRQSAWGHRPTLPAALSRTWNWKPQCRQRTRIRLFTGDRGALNRGVRSASGGRLSGNVWIQRMVPVEPIRPDHQQSKSSDYTDCRSSLSNRIRLKCTNPPSQLTGSAGNFGSPGPGWIDKLAINLFRYYDKEECRESRCPDPDVLRRRGTHLEHADGS
jgi:hypothetical protein